MSYVSRKQLRRLFIALPAPRFLQALCRFYCNTAEGEGFADMAINGEEDFLRSVAPDCRTVIDVGAHHGEWTARALACNEDLEIHCFEPAPEDYRKLVERSFPGQVICQRLAVSSTSGRQEMFLETGSLYPKPRRSPKGLLPLEQTEAVDLITLDAYCREHGIAEIDLLKLDIEGHEMEALRGASGLISEGRIRRIQFEYGPYNIYSRTFFKDFHELFQGHGYDVFKIVPRALLPISTYDERLENFIYKNFVAVHRSVTL